MPLRLAVTPLVALATVLFAAGCARPSATVCRAELPLDDRFNLIVTHVMVNGTPVPGILDTGAQTSAVTDGLVTRLGLLSDPRHGSLMSGVGGEGLAQNDALVSQFSLAGFDPGQDHYPVISLPVDDHDGEPLGALIGADVLSHFDIDLDVGHGRATLYDPDRCTQQLPDWAEPYDSVKLDVTWSERLLLDVKVDGHALRALLDSGATASVIDLPAAQKLGVTTEALPNEQSGEGFGAAGVHFHRVLHTFGSLEIAGERDEAPKLAVLDRSLQEADILLGLDWLRRHHVWISSRRHVMYIARPIG